MLCRCFWHLLVSVQSPSPHPHVPSRLPSAMARGLKPRHATSHRFLRLHRKSSYWKQSISQAFLPRCKMVAASYSILSLPFWSSPLFLDFCYAFVVTAFMLTSHLFGSIPTKFFCLLQSTSVSVVFYAVPCDI